MLVIAATNDEVLNHRIFHLAESQHKLVNVVDDQPHCSFIFLLLLIVTRSKLRFRVVARRRY